MTASGVIENMLTASASALTAKEKWGAARHFGGRAGPGDAWGYAFLVLAAVALVVLIGLLWWVSKHRKTPVRGLSRELFAENAVRRGLSMRERQILLAIAVRSGLIRSHDIFTTVEAFDRGATKLLAECRQTRTTDENERLLTEVASLREKLGFQVSQSARGFGPSRRTTSHDIPMNSVLELTRRRDHTGTTIHARVVRNDDIELAVDLEVPVETHATDAWRARYSFGLSVWEFDTTAVGCDGVRLVLNHTDYVRFVNRRRFPRVAVDLPALVAAFPFIQRTTAGAEPSPVGADRAGGPDEMAFEAPVFVPGVVTEIAGPGLRIEVPLEIRAGDRVIVAFRLPQTALEENETAAWEEDARIVESVGQVRHWRSTSQGVSIAVELIGLSEADIDTLVRITNRAAQAGPGGDGPPSSAEQNVEAVTAGRVIEQEV
jgi:hypothetical protein